MMKNYIGRQEEFLDDRKRFCNKLPVEIAKTFALHISKLRKVKDYLFERVEIKTKLKNLIHHAARRGQLKICKLIEEGNNLNKTTYFGSQYRAF